MAYLNRQWNPLLCRAMERLGWVESFYDADHDLMVIGERSCAVDEYVRQRVSTPQLTWSSDSPTWDVGRHDRRLVGRFFAKLLARPCPDNSVPWAVAQVSRQTFAHALVAFVSGREKRSRYVPYSDSWQFFRERGDIAVSIISKIVVPIDNAVPFLHSYADLGYISLNEQENGMDDGYMVECDCYYRGTTYNTCRRRFAQDHLYVHPDGIWRDNPPDSDDDDEVETTDSDGLLNYHSDGHSRAEIVRRIPSDSDDLLKDDTLTLGFEAEINVDNRHECVREVKEQLGEVGICERDGSLSDNEGFEFITGWSTLGTVKRWAAEWCYLMDHYEVDYVHAGLHITTSPLPPMHVGRVLGFAFDKTNRDFIRAIAGRAFNHHACDYCFLQGGGTQRKVAATYMKYRCGHDRYQAINPRNGDALYPNTIEWRMFKSTIRERVFLARLEFVWAATKFCDPLRCETLSADAFLMALIDNYFLRKHTPNLRSLLCDSIVVQTNHPKFYEAEKRFMAKQAKRPLILT